jgi:thioredoxin-dependent peroxiredoxin
VAQPYGMLPADVSGDAASRTPADNQTVRNVFVIGPDKKIRLCGYEDTGQRTAERGGR